MVYVIAFNGPPHSGKDTIANALQYHLESLSLLPTRVAALSMPMRLAGFGMLGILYSDEKYAEIKDLVVPALGVTFRKWMIDFSELFMKPTYGYDTWSQILLAAVEIKSPGFLVVTDLGFPDEDLRFAHQLGTENYLVIQLERDSCNWSKDSRNYVHSEMRQTLRLQNNGTVDEAVDHIMSQIMRMGWVL